MHYEQSMPFRSAFYLSLRNSLYVATRIECILSLPFSAYIVDYGRLKAVKFVLGEDTETCPKLSSYKDERSYCNGPLNPDTWYDVRMRAFTAGGYRDSCAFQVKTSMNVFILAQLYHH